MQTVVLSDKTDMQIEAEMQRLMKIRFNPCPVCGGAPSVGLCEPWSRKHGAAPWYAICYRMVPREHCVGVNGDDEADVIGQWNAEVAKAAPRGDGE